MISKKMRNTIIQMILLRKEERLSSELFNMGMQNLFECSFEVEKLEASRPLYVGFDRAKHKDVNVELLSEHREKKNRKIIEIVASTDGPEESA